MIPLNRTTRILLYMMLLSPLLAYIYIVWFNLPKNISFFFTIIIIIYGLIFTFKNKKHIIPLFAKFFLFFAFYKIAWKLLLDTPDINLFTQVYYYIFDFAIYFILIIVYNTRFSDKFITRSILIMKITVILALIASVIQVFDSGFLDASQYLKEDTITENKYEFRRSSIFGFIEPLALGLAFIPLVSVLVGYLLQTKKKNYYLFMLFGVLVALLSNTRFIMVGSFIILLQVLAFNKERFGAQFKYIIILSIGFLLILMTLQFLGYDFQAWYDQRLLREGSLEETTRYKAIENFAKFFPQKPLFGFGEMTKEITDASKAVGSSHIHVGYLSHLVAFGILGCFFLFGYWFILLKKLYRTAKVTKYWGSFFAFLTFLWAFATMSQSSIFYYGLIIAFVFDKYYSDKFKELSINKRIVYKVNVPITQPVLRNS